MTTEQSIREYLDSHGIKQAFIAKKCGWRRSKICDLLHGRRKRGITQKDVDAICAALGLPSGYFSK